MKSILIQNVQIIDPSQKIHEIGSILITDGKIAWLGKADERPPTSGYTIIEANNLIACPGFIDLHCHLRDPGFEEKETIATGTAAAAKGGFTTVCCMPNTEPPIDNRSLVDYIKEKAAAEGVIRVLPIGCITKGRKGETLAEMGELAEAGVVGFSDDGNPVTNSRLMRQALDYSRAFDLPVIEHCEDKTLSEGGQINEGVISTRLGLPGIPAAAEESMVARDIALAELTGARLHIAHISTAGSVALVRAAKLKSLRVTAEVTPHHLTLTEETVMGYDTNAKVNPPLRTRKDIEALIEGLRDNTIDAIATDHAPHSEVDKLCEFGYAPFGISILETAFGMLMGLVQAGKIDVNLLISKLTAGPAGIIGERFGKLGTLAVGCPADITLFDPNREWTVDPRTFVSKGKNTPLAGAKLKGKVRLTFYQGQIVYKDSD
ncbi:MAG TPA: dihydroorotase [Dehalococcoidales bacterium]|jgi:dihydroorotase